MTSISADVPWKDLVVHVWAPLVMAAPALVFPLTSPWLSVVLLGAAVAWGLAVSRYGPSPGLTWRRVNSPLALPALVVLGLAAIACASSAYPVWSIPKFASVLLGVWLGRAILLTATSPGRVRQLAVLYVIFGVGTIALGALAGPQWRGLGAGYFYDYAARFVPSLIRLPGVEAGPNTNAIGGTTLFFLPVCAALVWQWPRRRSTAGVTGLERWPRVGAVGERVLWLAGLLVVTFVLVISQSRTSWGSALLVVGFLLAVRFRIVQIACGIALVAATTAILWVGPSAVLQDLLVWLRPVIGWLDNGDRQVIWRFALEAIREHPWQGIGLGTFREVIHTMTVDGISYTKDTAHAHNIFLQVMLDLGLVGLLAYLTLLVVATRLTWQVCHSAADGQLRSICLGLWGGIIGTHLFGLVDAIALGAKVGIFFWGHLAFIGACGRLADADRNSEGTAVDRLVSL